MPTFDTVGRFDRDFKRLSPHERRAFLDAIPIFVEGLRSRQFRPGLRVRGVEGYPGIFEMTWAADGRATFEYGESVHEGEAHIIWRRVGTHAIFDEP